MLSARVFLNKDESRDSAETQRHAALKPDARNARLGAWRSEREQERCVGCIAARASAVSRAITLTGAPYLSVLPPNVGDHEKCGPVDR